MFSIGEFSKITGLTVKTLRLYHEKKLLIPRIVDEQTNYRYYDHSNIERARAVIYLRKMMFSLDQVKEILESYTDDSDVLDFLDLQRCQIQEKMSHLENVMLSLDELVRNEREAREIMETQDFEVEETELPDIFIAGIRWQGRYEETGKALSRLFKIAGRSADGKPFNLYYDIDYKEDDADIESCFPIKGERGVEGISCRLLRGGRAVRLIYRGPYDQIGRAYALIASFLQKNQLRALTPSREIYIKGPGVIFKGDPRKYLTEIQFLVKPMEEENEKNRI